MKRKTVEDQFQSYVVQMFGPQHPITKDDMKVMRQMFMAGYRMCYHSIQHITALPTEEAVQAGMAAMIEDLQKFFPGSSQLVDNPLGAPDPLAPDSPGKPKIELKGPLGLLGEDGKIKPVDPSAN
jgi:hypothetical protein